MCSQSGDEWHGEEQVLGYRIVAGDCVGGSFAVGSVPEYEGGRKEIQCTGTVAALCEPDENEPGHHQAADRPRHYLRFDQ
ncbi:hypothetical protein GCM10023166_32350 [Paeniglutamicibacter cryotolerans]